eukprot:3798538-Pyramimonas_sp.AAC.1
MVPHMVFSEVGTARNGIVSRAATTVWAARRARQRAARQRAEQDNFPSGPRCGASAAPPANGPTTDCEPEVVAFLCQH